MKCAACEFAQSELVHKAQMVQLLETRLALAAASIHHQLSPQDSPSAELQRELEATRAALARSESLNAELKVRVLQLRSEVVAHVARATRHQWLRQPTVDALWGGEDCVGELLLPEAER